MHKLIQSPQFNLVITSHLIDLLIQFVLITDQDDMLHPILVNIFQIIKYISHKCYSQIKNYSHFSTAMRSTLLSNSPSLLLVLGLIEDCYLNDTEWLLNIDFDAILIKYLLCENYSNAISGSAIKLIRVLLRNSCIYDRYLQYFPYGILDMMLDQTESFEAILSCLNEDQASPTILWSPALLEATHKIISQRLSNADANVAQLCISTASFHQELAVSHIYIRLLNTSPLYYKKIPKLNIFALALIDSIVETAKKSRIADKDACNQNIIKMMCTVILLQVDRAATIPIEKINELCSEFKEFSQITDPLLKIVLLQLFTVLSVFPSNIYSIIELEFDNFAKYKSPSIEEMLPLASLVTKYFTMANCNVIQLQEMVKAKLALLPKVYPCFNGFTDKIRKYSSDAKFAIKHNNSLLSEKSELKNDPYWISSLSEFNSKHHIIHEIKEGAYENVKLPIFPNFCFFIK